MKKSKLLAFILTGLLLSCEQATSVIDLEQTKASSVQHRGAEISPRILRRFEPLPPPKSSPDALVQLGRVLYFEKALSKDGQVSCNTCHPLDRYGTTRERLGRGVDGHKTTRNVPTTYNVSGHFRQFWDGRAADLPEQAKGPLTNPKEMGMTPTGVVEALQNSPTDYATLFKAAFPPHGQISFEGALGALAAFEEGLVTPGRWDAYLSGDWSALSAKEKEGAKTFANLGCLVCHTGPYLGGRTFEKLGVHRPWPNQNDQGRGDLTGRDEDKMVFKVPSLRNVAETGPYFHDGSATTLKDAIVAMGRHQLDIELEDEEVSAIAAWMKSLTGPLPQDYIREPVAVTP